MDFDDTTDLLKQLDHEHPLYAGGTLISTSVQTTTAASDGSVEPEETTDKTKEKDSYE